MNKRLFRRYIKISIAFFAVFNFISVTSLAGIQNNIKRVAFSNLDKIVITGTVKDEAGNPLKEATIFFDSTEVASTDNDGKFSFELNSITPNSHSIYFSCEGFVTVVRTYYPVMSSTSYDIILRKQFGNTKKVISNPVHLINKDSVHTIVIQRLPIVRKDSVHLVKPQPLPVVKKDSIRAIIKDSGYSKRELPVTPAETAIVPAVLDFPSIIFKTDLTALSGRNKAFLDIIADKLKNNPTVKVDIKAYAYMHDRDPLVQQKRLATIIKYLNQKGIAADRLKTIIDTTNAGELNTIDLITQTQ